MGIVNLTDNSFVREDRMGGRTPEEVVSRVGELLAGGADIIDLGACSTAPGNIPVSEALEWERLENSLPLVFSSFPKAVFSVDSFRSGVLTKAFSLACRFLIDARKQLIINDVSSASDRKVLELAASEGLRYVATCTDNNPMRFFTRFALTADSMGMDDWILDPGFGFGKSVDENWELLRNLDSLTGFGRPVLASLSRKRMIWEPLSLTPDDCISQSIGAERLAISKGASVIRTHDVISHIRLSFHNR